MEFIPGPSSNERLLSWDSQRALTWISRAGKHSLDGAVQTVSSVQVFDVSVSPVRSFWARLRFMYKELLGCHSLACSTSISQMLCTIVASGHIKVQTMGKVLTFMELIVC